MDFQHYPVMADTAIEYLSVSPDGVYADGTLGGAGHTKRILALLNEQGRVLGIDRDFDALKNAEETVADNRLLLWHGNYAEISEAMKDKQINALDGVLLDLGVSSYQLDTTERGFSYAKEAPLDMRMDQTQGLTAKDVVNTYAEKDLERIFRDYGEERFAGRIASRICQRREEAEITTTAQLSSIIASAYPKNVRFDTHPAKRCFQAIRIEVNDELSRIEPALNAAADALKPGGRMVVITFHSLEDRIVKNAFRKMENPCECPKDFPVCVCGKKPIVKILTRKPLLPTEKELAENSRSRSAKLRVAEKLPLTAPMNEKNLLKF